MDAQYNYSYHQVNNRRSLTDYNRGYTIPRMVNRTFGQRVKARRLELRLTQDQLAKLVGISQVAIKKIESGGATRKGRLLADALQTSLTWLETGEDLNQHLLQSEVRPAPLSTQWPFGMIDIQRVLRLSDRQIGYVEGRLADALSEIENRDDSPSAVAGAGRTPKKR